MPSALPLCVVPFPPATKPTAPGTHGPGDGDHDAVADPERDADGDDEAVTLGDADSVGAAACELNAVTEADADADIDADGDGGCGERDGVALVLFVAHGDAAAAVSAPLGATHTRRTTRL